MLPKRKVGRVGQCRGRVKRIGHGKFLAIAKTPTRSFLGEKKLLVGVWLLETMFSKPKLRRVGQRRRRVNRIGHGKARGIAKKCTHHMTKTPTRSFWRKKLLVGALAVEAMLSKQKVRRAGKCKRRVNRIRHRKVVAITKTPTRRFFWAQKNSWWVFWLSKRCFPN